MEQKNSDTIYTQNMKKQFPLFGIGSMLYAIFYTFCLYKNASGITYPFFVVGTLFFFFYCIQKLGVLWKKDSVFYIISILLLGISNCLTTSPWILQLNKCGIFLLFFILMLHTVYQDKDWNLPKYFSALFQTIGNCLSCLFRPFSDMAFYFDAQKNNKTVKKDKKSLAMQILIGFVITVPVLLFITMLLASADAVFEDILEHVLFSKKLIDIDLFTIFQVCLLTVVVFFCSYAVLSALCMKKVIETVKDRKVFNPVTAIVVTTSLSAVYLIFSVIQILFLFIGNMKLPDGYTYSRYAREGFFQLLAVCILNLLIVLVCLYLFRESTALKIILTIISGCTYIMILSSALRMIMYINEYDLTFLRIFVLWSLTVIFLLMTGITIFIYYGKFPLFKYGLIVVTVLYIGLSFAHPDYWIAKYNLKDVSDIIATEDEHLISMTALDGGYLDDLSSDAAPILLNPERNPYISGSLNLTLEDLLVHQKDYEDIYERERILYFENLYWIRYYYVDIEYQVKDMYFRYFNFSTYRAKKYLLDK